MHTHSRTSGEFTFTYAEPSTLQAVENTELKHVAYEPVLDGFASWDMFQNTGAPEMEPAELAATDLDAEAFAEGLRLSEQSKKP